MDDAAIAEMLTENKWEARLRKGELVGAQRTLVRIRRDIQQVDLDATMRYLEARPVVSAPFARPHGAHTGVWRRIDVTAERDPATGALTLVDTLRYVAGETGYSWVSSYGYERDTYRQVRVGLYDPMQSPALATGYERQVENDRREDGYYNASLSEVRHHARELFYSYPTARGRAWAYQFAHFDAIPTLVAQVTGLGYDVYEQYGLSIEKGNDQTYSGHLQFGPQAETDKITIGDGTGEMYLYERQFKTNPTNVMQMAMATLYWHIESRLFGTMASAMSWVSGYDKDKSRVVPVGAVWRADRATYWGTSHWGAA